MVELTCFRKLSKMSLVLRKMRKIRRRERGVQQSAKRVLINVEPVDGIFDRRASLRRKLAREASELGQQGLVVERRVGFSPGWRRRGGDNASVAPTDGDLRQALSGKTPREIRILTQSHAGGHGARLRVAKAVARDFRCGELSMRQ